MNKIEDEATDRYGTGHVGLAGKNGFIEGALYVLDAMTSPDAVRALIAAQQNAVAGIVDAEDALAAVRKEIEGE